MAAAFTIRKNIWAPHRIAGTSALVLLGVLQHLAVGIQPVFAGIYFNARTYLIDPSVANLTPAVAIAAALGFLALGWLVYDLLCRLFGKNEKLLSALIVAYVIAAAWAACHLFSGRAAFLITGAMIATIMSANVFFWIIPGQRKVVAAMKAGAPVDPVHGQRGKQRSVHNTYFTLPVLFAMLSNHYSMTYNHAQNWLVLVLIMVVGVLVRQFFILRHKGKPAPFIRCWRSSSSLRWLRGWHQNPRLSAAQKNHRQRSLLRFNKSYKHAAYNVMQNIRH
jgi:uncharacterized membrane protein